MDASLATRKTYSRLNPHLSAAGSMAAQSPAVRVRLHCPDGFASCTRSDVNWYSSHWCPTRNTPSLPSPNIVPAGPEAKDPCPIVAHARQLLPFQRCRSSMPLSKAIRFSNAGNCGYGTDTKAHTASWTSSIGPPWSSHCNPPSQYFHHGQQANMTGLEGFSLFSQIVAGNPSEKPEREINKQTREFAYVARLITRIRAPFPHPALLDSPAGVDGVPCVHHARVHRHRRVGVRAAGCRRARHDARGDGIRCGSGTARRKRSGTRML